MRRCRDLTRGEAGAREKRVDRLRYWRQRLRDSGDDPFAKRSTLTQEASAESEGDGTVGGELLRQGVEQADEMIGRFLQDSASHRVASRRRGSDDRGARR